jgi:DNA modification methylase
MLTILQGDWIAQLRTLPDCSVNCCVTSPPYWNLRDYSVNGQLGLEKTPDEYCAKMVEGFREVRRVLREDGTLWMNLGDSYNTKPGSTLKPKDMCGIPWMAAFALRADGWYLRQDIIWHKPNPMPESITDRCTKAHEYIFLLSKSARYYYDFEAVQEPVTGKAHRRSATPTPAGWGVGDEPRTAIELQRDGVHRKSKAPASHHGSDFRNGKKAQVHPNVGQRDRVERVAGVTPKSAVPGSGIKANESFHAACVDLVEIRNKRSVWTVASQPYPEAHFATYPPDLIKPCILAGCPVGGTVLDPFGGSGTTGQVALELGRKAILIELNPEYVKLIERRTNVTPGLPL